MPARAGDSPGDSGCRDDTGLSVRGVVGRIRVLWCCRGILVGVRISSVLAIGVIAAMSTGVGRALLHPQAPMRCRLPTASQRW